VRSPSWHHSLVVTTQESMKIVVTGGAGFIGSHLIQALHGVGHSVTVIDELNDYYDPALKRANLELIKPEQFFQTDLRDADAVERIFAAEHYDAIIHLGARAGVRPSLLQPDLYTSVNVLGTLNLLNAAVQHNVPQFIFGSTSAVYGNSTVLPFQETADVSAPISPYAASKRSAEILCEEYQKKFGLLVTVLRFFTVYGERGRPDMAPYLFTKAVLTHQPITRYGDGSTSRDYTYVTDIVAGIMLAIANPFPFEIINLGNNHGVPLNDFIHTIEQVTGETAVLIPSTMQAGDVNHTLADVSKAKQLLGWEPQVGLVAGLTHFVKWFKTNRL